MAADLHESEISPACLNVDGISDLEALNEHCVTRAMKFI